LERTSTGRKGLLKDGYRKRKREEHGLRFESSTREKKKKNGGVL